MCDGGARLHTTVRKKIGCAIAGGLYNEQLIFHRQLCSSDPPQVKPQLTPQPAVLIYVQAYSKVQNRL